MMSSLKYILIIALVLALSLGLSGCNQGPLAGKAIDSGTPGDYIAHWGFDGTVLEEKTKNGQFS